MSTTPAQRSLCKDLQLSPSMRAGDLGGTMISQVVDLLGAPVEAATWNPSPASSTTAAEGAP